MTLSVSCPEDRSLENKIGVQMGFSPPPNMWFYANLTQDGVLWEEENSMGRMHPPPPNGPVVYFLN